MPYPTASLLWAYSFFYGTLAHPNPDTRSLIHRDAEILNASELLDMTVKAMGGNDALKSLSGLTYHAPNIYRSQTLTQSYNLMHSDHSVAASGSQNISFNFALGYLQQRIDRFYRYSEYWIWAFPDLSPPMNWSLVVQDGPDSFACFVEGQNSFFTVDPSVALGYTDPFLTDYLIHNAQQFAIPGLILQFQKNNASLKTLTISDTETNMTFPAIENTLLGLTLILNATSHLPYMVRSYESHALFGPSTNDILLSDYKPVNMTGKKTSILLPHRFQTLYNSADVLEDFIVESITLNPKFPATFFHGLEANASQLPRAKPEQSPEYNRAEVHEFFETALWSGPFDFNVSDVVSTHPVPGLARIQSVYIGYADYVQLVVEFDDGVVVVDAPPHRSKILLRWIQQTIGKPVTHIVPSHHHHDHAYGIEDYVAAGATVVVPEVAVEFYKKLNNENVTFVSHNETHPFVLKDSTVQFRSIWHDEPPHAKDWTYSLATAACPTPEDAVVVFNADVWSPGTYGERWDTGYARQWLDAAVQDGLPRDHTIVVGAHGSSSEHTTDVLQTLLDITGYAYPDLTAQDWKAGGTFC